MGCHSEQARGSGRTSPNRLSTQESAIRKESNVDATVPDVSRGDVSGGSSVAELGNNISSNEYIIQLEHELEERSRQLSKCENDLQRIKNTSKKALEEFKKINESYQKEALRRQQAETHIAGLRNELSSMIQADARRARIEENILRLNQEVKFLLSQRSTLEDDIRQLSGKKEALSIEVGHLLENKHSSLADGGTAETADPHADLKKELEQIKARFFEEVSNLQQERDVLRQEVETLRSTREDHFNNISRLIEENKQLEVRHDQITKQLVASADHVQAVDSILLPEPGMYPQMEELERTVSTDELGAKLPPAPPPRTTTRPLGPRQDSRGDTIYQPPRKEEAVDLSAPPPVPKKDKWKKEWKTNLKATKTKLKKAIPQSKTHTGENADAVGGSTTGLLSYGHGMFKLGSKKAMSKSDGDLSQIGFSPAKGDKSAHSFQLHSYRSPRKCDFCHDTLWGKELRCEACGYHCHQKCSPQVIGQCFSSNVATESDQRLTGESGVVVFGTDLVKLLEIEGGRVPNVVTACIAAVEMRGMTFEGIYRKSGPLTQINKIIASINRGEVPDLTSDESDIDIMAVTSVLKQFFRELPEPLLVSSLYADLTGVMKSTEDDEARLPKIIELLRRLPPAHFTTLSYLIMHLHRVQQHSSENLMTPTNLGVVFGPSLVRPAHEEMQLDMAESSAKNALVEFFVRHATELFPVAEVETPERTASTVSFVDAPVADDETFNGLDQQVP
ncbi:hypothetical protein, variant [Spizellomyces punctatus DAOM BR117]|nr:hypothetical protein, variant [Spizellomyces punctatus DAOM BR117]KNC99455.1 hypothetical protein, variant [Spizellomyces punctatus DAOM BR117]|eukprot:XP_016607495.1 hypothetical protein, variant [Spizellomyces punctatus DAOM BR117]